MYIYTYTHIYMYACIHIYMYTYIHMHIQYHPLSPDRRCDAGEDIFLSVTRGRPPDSSFQ